MVAKLFTVPFASNGDVVPVPDASQVDGSVSYDRGFGADYDRQLGVDPQAKSISRENWNSVQRDVTTALQEMQSGLGLPPFDLDFAASLPGTGYPRAAIVPRADGAGYWQNQNVGVSLTDPTTAGSGWVPLNVKGSFTQALTNVNVTLSPSNAAFHTLILTGALTGNVAITLPAWSGYNWVVDNRCTGAFIVTILVTAGVPATVPNGAATPVFCDGTNIRLGVALLQAAESAPGIAKIATQALTNAGVDDATIVTPKKLFSGVLSALGFTPVRQGGGVGQGNNKVYIGWSGSRLKATVDETDLGSIIFDNNTATESVVGVAKVATQAQTNAGADDATFVTPKKLAAYSVLGFQIVKGDTGYIKLPDFLGGFVMQWTKTPTLSTSTNYTWNFPLGFPNKCAGVSGTLIGFSQGPLEVTVLPTQSAVSLSIGIQTASAGPAFAWAWGW